MLARSVASAAAAVVLVALVLLASQGPVFAILAVALGFCAVAVATVGTEKFGTALVIAGVFTAPMNDVRPIPSADIATFSDVFLLVGFLLLVPQLVSADRAAGAAGRRPRPSALHLVGSLVLVTFGMLASLASPEPLTSIGYLLRMLTALTFLPLAFVFWRPSRRLVEVMAWAYVLGQLVSMLGGFARGPVGNNRYDGLTTHPNFYGICAVVAGGICLFLLHRTPRPRRWIPLLALAGCAASVLNSGSRAALLTAVLLAVLYPLLERSGKAGYALALGAALLVGFANTLLPHVREGSAIDRLLGNTSSAGSDNVREQALTSTFQDFLHHPLLGEGFSATTTETHNAYLEVANAFGIFALLGYVAILWAMARLVFRQAERNRLAYAAVGYAFIVLFINTIWDRFAWVALCLVFAWAAAGSRVSTSSTTDGEEGDDEITDACGAPRRADAARLRQRVPAAG